MEDTHILKLLRSALGRTRKVDSPEGVTIELPFSSSWGDSIRINVISSEHSITVNDLGHTAGLLFETDQDGEQALGHQLVKALTRDNGISMDYNRGMLLRDLDKENIGPELTDFVKVLVTIQTAIPRLRVRKSSRPGMKRLSARLGREFKDLRVFPFITRGTEVQGRHDSWTVDYRYSSRNMGGPQDVIIVTADLRSKEPRMKAEHVVTLAMDVLAFDSSRQVRVVYDLQRNGGTSPSERAASMLNEYQEKVGFRAFDYADVGQRGQLMASAMQELTLPLSGQPC